MLKCHILLIVNCIYFILNLFVFPIKKGLYLSYFILSWISVHHPAQSFCFFQLIIGGHGGGMFKLCIYLNSAYTYNFLRGKGLCVCVRECTHVEAKNVM